jgi:signal transduction histidine kinase
MLRADTRCSASKIQVPASLNRTLREWFEPFYRGQRSAGEGTGLGLSIVERIAAGASGSVSIENIAAPGSGLRVVVTFAQVMLSETASRQESEIAPA